MRCILVGNFGVGNFGDEAIKEAFLERYPQIQWDILSAYPTAEEYPRLPCGLHSLFHLWPRTLIAYARADAIVFAGGSLFTDIESVRACLIWWWHVWIGHLLRTPVFLTFQGVGPFRTKLGERLARHAFSMATYISVRDTASWKRVAAWKTTKIVQTFDSVFSLYINKKKDIRANNVFIIIPRHNPSRAFLTAVQETLKRPWRSIRILSLEPDNLVEKAAITKIHALSAHHGRTVDIIPVRSVDGLLHWLSDGEYVLAQRFHGALAAFALGIPMAVVPQGQQDKLAELQVTADHDVSRDDLKRLVDDGFASLEMAFSRL